MALITNRARVEQTLNLDGYHRVMADLYNNVVGLTLLTYLAQY